MKATLLANEHYELQKITRVVIASDLALLHIAVRLETIRDVGDVMFVLTNAFKAVRKIGKSIYEVAPNLEKASQEITESFSSILSELRTLSPNVTLALSDSPQQIFEKAQQLISEKTSELGELPKEIQESNENVSIFEKTKRIALLATEDEEEEESEDDETGFGPVMFEPQRNQKDDPDSAIRDYLVKNGFESNLDISKVSQELGIPPDQVERSYLKLLSQQQKIDNESKESSHSRSKNN